MADPLELVTARLERRIDATERELADARLAIRHMAAMLEAATGNHCMAGQADFIRLLVTGNATPPNSGASGGEASGVVAS